MGKLPLTSTRQELVPRWKLSIGEEAKAFLKPAALARWIPDKMSDPQRGKVLTGVPSGQPCDCAAGFILPKPPPDLFRL